MKKNVANGKLSERPNVFPVVFTDWLVGWLVGYDQTGGKIAKNLKPVQ